MASLPSCQDSSRKRRKAAEAMSSYDTVPFGTISLSDLVSSEAFGNNKTSTMTSQESDSSKETLFVTHSSTSTHNDILTRLAQARADLETKFEKPRILELPSKASQSSTGQDLGIKLDRPVRKFKVVTAGRGSRGTWWESRPAKPPPKSKGQPKSKLAKQVSSGFDRFNGNYSNGSSPAQQTQWMREYDPTAQGQPETEVLKTAREEYAIVNVTSGGPPRGFVPICEQKAARRALGLKVNHRSDSNASTSQEHSKPFHPTSAFRSDNEPWLNGVAVGARALGQSSQSKGPRPEVAEARPLVKPRKHVQTRRKRSLSCPVSVYDAARQFSQLENVVVRLSKVSSTTAARDRGTHLSPRYRQTPNICNNEYQTIVESLALDRFSQYKISSGIQTAPASPTLLASQNNLPVFEATALSENSNFSTNSSGIQRYSKPKEHTIMDPTPFGFPTQQQQFFMNGAGVPVASGSQQHPNRQRNFMMNPTPFAFPMQQPPFFINPGELGPQHYPIMQEGPIMNPMHSGFPFQQQPFFMNSAMDLVAPGSQHYPSPPEQFMMNPAPPGFPYQQQHPFMYGALPPVAAGSQRYSNRQEELVFNSTPAVFPVQQHQFVQNRPPTPAPTRAATPTATPAATPAAAPVATPTATQQPSPPSPPAPKWTIKYEWDAIRGTGAQHFSPTDGTEHHSTLEAWYHYETKIGHLKPTSKIDFDCDIPSLGIRQNSRVSLWALGALIEKRQKDRDQHFEEVRIKKAKAVELAKQAAEKKKQADAEAKEKKMEAAAEAKKTKAAQVAERRTQQKEINKEKRRLLKESKRREEKEREEKELRQRKANEEADMDEYALRLLEEMEQEKKERQKQEQKQKESSDSVQQLDMEKEGDDDGFGYLFEGPVHITDLMKEHGEVVEEMNEYEGDGEDVSDVDEEENGSVVYHIRNAEVTPLQEGEEECVVYKETFEAQCENSDSESEISEAE